MKMCVWKLFLMVKIWFKNSTHKHTCTAKKRRMKKIRWRNRSIRCREMRYSSIWYLYSGNTKPFSWTLNFHATTTTITSTIYTIACKRCSIRLQYGSASASNFERSNIIDKSEWVSRYWARNRIEHDL